MATFPVLYLSVGPDAEDLLDYVTAMNPSERDMEGLSLGISARLPDGPKVLWTFPDDVGMMPAVSSIEWLTQLLGQPEVAYWIVHDWGTGSGGGYAPGDFYAHLLKAAGHADRAHLAQLHEAFPALGAGVLLWTRVSGSPDLFATLIADEWWDLMKSEEPT